MAGVDHQKVLFKKTPAVEQEVKRTIDMFGKAPGLIIAPGCEMPFKTHREHSTDDIVGEKIWDLLNGTDDPDGRTGHDQERRPIINDIIDRYIDHCGAAFLFEMPFYLMRQTHLS